MSINAIRDAVKALAQSLQVSTIFPASLFVLVNAYLVLPAFLPDLLDLTSASAATMFISLTLMLSYTFYAFNFPMIRLFEGYKLQEADWFYAHLKKHRANFKELIADIETIRKKSRQYDAYFTVLKRKQKKPKEEDKLYAQQLGVRLARYSYRFDQDYPSNHEMVLPTKLGNTIVAFEDYPRTRYGMESIVLWSRLVPVLKEKGYLEFVTQEKSVFDFLMNTCVVAAVLGIELVYLTLFLGHLCGTLCTAVLMCATVVILYNGMIIAARQWGTTVRVAFDLYRHDLHRRLGLQPAVTFREEFERWEKISDFLLRRKRDRWKDFGEFVPQSKPEEPSRHARRPMRRVPRFQKRGL